MVITFFNPLEGYFFYIYIYIYVRRYSHNNVFNNWYGLNFTMFFLNYFYFLIYTEIWWFFNNPYQLNFVDFFIYPPSSGLFFNYIHVIKNCSSNIWFFNNHRLKFISCFCIILYFFSFSIYINENYNCNVMIFLTTNIG